MPDQNSPAAKPDPTSPDEFEFDVPVKENPRLKRRSLKVKSTETLAPVPDTPPPSAARELEREAPPLSATEAKPEHQPKIEDDADAEINAEVKITEPAPTSTPTPASSPAAKISTGYIPRTTASATATSPHGTRPATLYYSQRKEKEEPSPMKTTPTASPTSSTSAARPTGTSPSSPASASTAARPASTTSTASLRPASVVDYRSNIDRQAREQKSIGGILSIIVYSLIFVFVVCASLTGYGIFALSKQLEKQSLTINDLDKKYAEQQAALQAQLTATGDTLAKTQAQVGRQQELINQQQEALNKLMAANDSLSSALKQEKQSRASETASLRSRVNSLENRELSR